MSSRSLEYFSSGLTRAFERRRAMQPTKQHLDQVVQVQSVDSVGGDENTITAINSASTRLSDEQYKATIIEHMINHIHNQRKPSND